jgi:hypothetical protein
MRTPAAAALLLLTAAGPAAAGSLERAARELAAAARRAGVVRVAVVRFDAARPEDAPDGRLAADLLSQELVRAGRVEVVDRELTPSLLGAQEAAGDAPGGLAAPQALVAGVVARRDGRRVALARLVDARSGLILAAAAADLPEAAAPPAHRPSEDRPRRGRLFALAARLLGSPDNYGPGHAAAEERAAAAVTLAGAPAQRAAGALALGTLPGPRAQGLLNGALDDADPAVRGAAAVALGLRSDGATRVRLAWTARTDPDAGVRRAAALALAAR